MGQFSEQVVWITGGGTGLGRGIAEEVARRGAMVAVSGRRQERLDEVVAAIQGAGGVAAGIVCDVTDEEGVRRARDAVVERFGGIDVVIANAGVSVSGKIEKVTTAEWRRQFDINVIGLTTTVREALPYVKQRQGRVVLIGSVAAMIAAPGFAPYHASKYAVRAIGQCLAMGLEGTGASCTTIHPGFVESEIAKVDNAGTFHADRPDTRPQRFMWPTDRAAKVMTDAFHARKREFTFTNHGILGAWVGRHTPWLAHMVMTKASAKLRPPRAQKT